MSLLWTYVIHDDLDLPVGQIRIKDGGGHGGHNGLRDIIKHCSADFMRIRVGINHPGNKDLVTSWVLTKFSKNDQNELDNSFYRFLRAQQGNAQGRNGGAENAERQAADERLLADTAADVVSEDIELGLDLDSVDFWA